MRLIHLSDFHLGKRVNEFSMLEDQKYIVKQILEIIEAKKVDGVLVAGDIYDKSVPGEEAIGLWNYFLNGLAEKKIPVYAISGNHDSAVRVSSYRELVNLSGIHLAPAYAGQVVSYTMKDDFGSVNIYLLPFIKPAIVRAVFPKEEIKDYTDACRVVIQNMNVNPRERNILVAHQYVAGAKRCESEELTIGGLDCVDASVFDVFDYVALGHLHGQQWVERETIRYCGTPLKYSFSEINHHKCVVLVELKEKGQVEISKEELQPLHDMREIKGSYETLTQKKNYENTNKDDYLHVILTDEEDVYEAMAKLRLIYPNMMKLTYDNTRTREKRDIQDVVDVERKSPLELIEDFYEIQNNQKMTEEQRDFCSDLIESIWEVK